MRDLLAMMKALSNPNRLRIVSALNGHELCLCQIAELLGLVTSSASQHMSILQQARLVESQRHGRWTHFRLVGDDAPLPTREAISLVRRALQGDRQAREDARRLTQILRVDPEDLRRRQNECQC